jgi:hypothetical protein
MNTYVRIAQPGILLATLLACLSVSNAQSIRYETIVPGERYRAGTVHRVLYGDLWRDLWTTPVRVPVLDLAAYAGGLKTVRRGGGMQTKSLRFLGADGIQYKFRSLDKDPSQTLDKALRETFVDDILQDLISTANPYGALVAAPLLTAAGTLQAPPSLVILPDDPALGDFQSDFGGLLGTLEVHPNETDTGGFAGSEKVVGTFTLLGKMQKRTKHRVHAVEFLKARLIDMFIGDWDRHTDQWRWAQFKEDGNIRWYPIPRDRDQAFCRYDGLVPWLATVVVPQLESCDEDYPGIQYLTYSGRHLDRRFLSEVDWPVYDSLLTDLLFRFDDTVLREAVASLPDECETEVKDDLLLLLQSRKAGLREAARKYYELLSREVDIHCSDEDETIEIQRQPEGNVAVAIRTQGKPGLPPFFSRVFDPGDTGELRIYCDGGNDEIQVRGHGTRDVTIRVIGGDGQDTFIDSSIIGNGFPLFLKPTSFYDDEESSSFTGGSAARIDHRALEIPEDEPERYEPQQRDWGSELLPAVMAAYNNDLGVLLGGGPVYTRYGFMHTPFEHQISLLAGLAPLEVLGRLELRADFRDLVEGHSVTLSAGISGYEVLNFFGYGNRSVRENDAAHSYTVKQTQVHFSPTLHLFLSKRLTVNMGMGVRLVTNDLDDETLYISVINPYGTEQTVLSHLEVGIDYDSRNSAAWPVSGVYATLRARHHPALFDLFSRFETVRGEVRTYVSSNFLTEWTLALRGGGQYNHGRFPFFEAAFLGGMGSARGYVLNRYAGKASAYGTVELRALFGKTHVVLPTEIGGFLFVESGRVFEEHDDDATWHPSRGAGIWLAPVQRSVTLSASVGFSHETTRIDAAAGFAF